MRYPNPHADGDQTTRANCSPRCQHAGSDGNERAPTYQYSCANGGPHRCPDRHQRAHGN